MHRLILALLLACGGEPSLAPLPGADPLDPALEQRLLEAGRKLPEEARRTQHLRKDGTPRYTNRLALQTSPYLQQHAHQPVDWHPWGPEALALARSTGRPILLSIGYATCHWCHVMARESFDDEGIAALINARYVPIKVDREERPDVDATYMEALVAMRGRGGWPATLVLTPEGHPLFAATYLPPNDGDRGVQKGLRSVLDTLAQAWETDREALIADAARLTGHLAERATPAPPGELPAASILQQTAERLLATFDATHGGFGTQPKFPRPSVLTFLLRHHHRTGDEAALDAVVRSLRAMARSALYDQVGGGFHRYTTDPGWQVPHFEKMLYDQAQLAMVYLEAYQATTDPELAQVARETLDFMIREMGQRGGGFRSALDAESEGEGGRQEGLFYTWTPEEVRAVVDDEAVLQWFGLHQPARIDGRHALTRPLTLEEAARTAEVGPEALQERLRTARRALFQARAQRPRPPSDDKVVTAWHALAISALVHGYQVLGEEAWLHRAARSGEFAIRRLRARNTRLHRSWRGELGHHAVLEDYAFLIRALLDLHEGTGELRWLQQAVQLQTQQEALFAAEGGAWYRTPSDGDPLLTRTLPVEDASEPSGTSVALDNLHRFVTLLGTEDHAERLEASLKAVARPLTARGDRAPMLMTAFARSLYPPREIVIVGEEGEARDALVAEARGAWLPHRTLLVLTPEQVRLFQVHIPLLQGKDTVDQPTAYVCERGICEAPTADAQVLRAQLRTPRPPSP